MAQRRAGGFVLERVPSPAGPRARGITGLFTLGEDDIAPTWDYAWQTASAAIRRRYWEIVIEVVLREKDLELARGLDRHGKPLAKLSLKTIMNRVSAMGPADPMAPPLTPAYDLSRTRAFLTGRVDGQSVVFGWRKGWGQILEYHARGGRHLPVRDVIGLAPETFDRVRRLSLHWWVTNKGRLIFGSKAKVPPVRARVTSAGEVVVGGKRYRVELP